MDKLYGSIVTKQTVNGVLALPYGSKRYEGKYEVTPNSVGEVLETANKMMVDDVTIHPIPYQDVDNPQGGRTVTIAFE